MKKNAFTLVELLIVLALVTLLLGLSLPYFANSLPTARLHEAARETAAMMRYAGTEARIENRDQTLIIDTNANTCAIEGKMSRTFPVDVQVKVIDPFLGEVRRGKYAMLFPSTGGAEGGTVVISTGTKAVSIRVDPIVGSVIEHDSVQQ